MLLETSRTLLRPLNRCELRDIQTLSKRDNLSVKQLPVETLAVVPLIEEESEFTISSLETLLELARSGQL